MFKISLVGKIVSVSKIKPIIKKLTAENKKIVLAGGCFDILHIGHIKFLEAAKKSGDVLILLLESDSAIKKLKGEKRPVNKQENRAKVLEAVEFVDRIVLLEDLLRDIDYQNLVSQIKPDIIAVTAGDPNLENKKLQAKSVNGKLKIVLKQIPEHSTTKLLDYF